MEAKDPDTTFTDGGLTVAGDHLSYDGKSILLSDVTAIRFGWLPISFYHFTIGSKWMLVLKTPGQEIKINYSSYFGMFQDRQYEKFNTLLNVIWDSTVQRLLNTMMDELEKGKTITIGKCAVSKDGISVYNFLIKWNDLVYQKNYNRLTINSRSRSDIWTNLHYTDTNNVQLLMSFLEWKFEDKEPS